MIMTPDLTTSIAPTADEVRRSVASTTGHRKLLVFAVLGLAGAGAAAFVITQSEPPPTEWATRSVDRGDIVSTASATGNLQPRTTVTVGSEISGLVKSVEVADSETVVAGQVLATFDETDLGAQLDLAKASLSSSNASVRRAVASYDEAVAEEKRTQGLVDRGVTARANLDAARAVTASPRNPPTFFMSAA